MNQEETNEMEAPIEPPKFANVYCSQCGEDFGPGEHGYSHCKHHADKVPI